MADLKQQIFEMRYKPNSAIIDRRGTYAKLIAKELKFEQWIITNDGSIVEMKNKEKKAFITVDRMGISINGAFVSEGFKNESVRFLQMIMALDVFEEKIHITRLGIRTRNCVAFDDTFTKLRSYCLDKYISIPQRITDRIGLEISDVGYPIYFKDGQATVTTNCGPMEKEQITAFYKDYTEGSILPEVGLFIDIDYFSKPDKLMNVDEISSIITDYCIKSEEKYEVIKSIILG